MKKKFLKNYTTFRIGGSPRLFKKVSSHEALVRAVEVAHMYALPIYILGGGSNILCNDEKDLKIAIIKIALKGRKIVRETSTEVELSVASGEILDEIIQWTVENHWSGMENLSFVPGEIGGLAIQNVNCYGQNASNIIKNVSVYNMHEKKEKTFSNAQCEFGYRKSIFNTVVRGRYVVTSVSLILKKQFMPNLTYLDIQKWFSGKNPNTISLEEMRNAVISIRKKKGQDPEEYWSAGSFFKNLYITETQFQKLYSTIVNDISEELGNQLMDMRDRFRDTTDDTSVKVSTAFILDKILNIKGMCVGDAKVSEKQAINIINRSNASARDVLILFRQIRKLAHQKLGLLLENEPELVGFTKEDLDYYFSLEN